MDIGGER
jgi:hypothetical protein